MQKPQPQSSAYKKKNLLSPAKKVTKNLFQKTEKRWSFTRKYSPNELSNLYHYVNDFVTHVPKKGTFFISKSNNGTVAIKVRPYVTDRVNIRQVQYNYILLKMEKKNKNMHSAFQHAFSRGGRSVSNLHSYVVADWWQYIQESYRGIPKIYTTTFTEISKLKFTL